MFGFDVVTSMESLKKRYKVLENSQSTVDFIRRFYSLIKAMNSSCKKGALFEKSEELKVN